MESRKAQQVTVFFTSDTHFQHALVSAHRGFASPAEHDEELIARWNETVGPDDTVWHLGDVTMGDRPAGLKLAARLNGTKHLIAGNHDHCWPGDRRSFRYQRAYLEAFESVQAFAQVKVGGYWRLLSHFPYDGDHVGEERATQFRLRDEGAMLLHGHIHDKTRRNGRQIHVGLDAWDLRPVPEDDIAALMTSGLRDSASPLHAREKGGRLRPAPL